MQAVCIDDKAVRFLAFQNRCDTKSNAAWSLYLPQQLKDTQKAPSFHDIGCRNSNNNVVDLVVPVVVSLSRMLRVEGSEGDFKVDPVHRDETADINLL